MATLHLKPTHATNPSLKLNGTGTQKAIIVRGFCSTTSTQALKSFMCFRGPGLCRLPALHLMIICIFKSLAFNNRSKLPPLVHVWQETPRPADNTSIEYIVSLSQARTGGFKRFLDSFAPKKTVCSSARGLNLLTFNGYVVPCSRGTYAGIKE